MQMLVSDTSVLVDLERGSFLKASFRLPFQFAVPDLLYEHELKDHDGEELKGLGLVIEELAPLELTHALTIHQRVPALSLPDSFAFALAHSRIRMLLTGDATLRQLADDAGIKCHGVLWLLDEINNAGTTSIQKLYNGLTAISQHPRCRLPKAEVNRRLTTWGGLAGSGP